MIRKISDTCLEKVGSHKLIRNIAVAGFLFWLVLLVGGIIGYSGSKPVYFLFSIVFLVMLVSGFYRQVCYSYLFLVVFLWLGFWLKLTIHTIVGYDYIEPIGAFVGTATAWDEVLWVAIVAGTGVVVGRLLYGFGSGRSTMVMQNNRIIVPLWYPAIRKQLWIAMMFVTIGVVIFNVVYGIHQIGLVPRTILLWPMNAVISWMLNIGLAISIGTLIWWDVSLKRNISVSIYAILIEGYLTSVSVLSRGVYIYHLIPQLYTLFKNKKSIIGITYIKAIFIAMTFLGLFIVSQSAVNTLRAYLFQTGYDFSSKIQIKIARLELVDEKIKQIEKLIQKDNELLITVINKSELEKLRIKIGIAEKQLKELREEKVKLQITISEEKKRWEELSESWSGKAKMLSDEFIYQLGGGIYGRILRLSVDRWLGLEGVMAVQSYPKKGGAFFIDGIKEKREIGKVTSYQEVCKSHYRKASNTFQFGSMPGAAGFLYYSGSLWVVLLGMITFSLLILLTECLIDMLTANPLLCSLLGFAIANTVAQFGVAPRQDIPHYFMIFSMMVLLWFIQGKWFFRLLQKFGLYRGIVFDVSEVGSIPPQNILRRTIDV